MNLTRFGRAKKPAPMATLHPLMQAHFDLREPFWVSTDTAIWGTFGTLVTAVHQADRIAAAQPIGTRIIVIIGLALGPPDPGYTECHFGC